MEELNANIGDAASTPTNDVGATGASGVDATSGQQNVELSNQGQTVPESTAEEFSAGWSFEDDAQVDPAETEGEDADIQGMLNDPNLDQARVPGLVESLRGARAQNKQFKAELQQLRDENAALKNGGFGIANDLIYNPEEAALPFLQQLSQKALPAYRSLVNTLAQHAPDSLIYALQATGNLPETQTAANQLTAEDWARVPEELRDIAKQIPIAQMIEWLDKGTDENLIFNLQTHKELSELKGAQKEQAEKEWRTASQQAQAQGQSAVSDLTGQYEKAHVAQLSKWQPFGPNDPQNQFLYTSILEGAHAMLLADKQWFQMYQDAVGKLKEAPMRRLRGEHLAADQDERDARGLAARYNARLGQVMKAHIKSLDSVFRDARAYRETQRQQIPNRTEISGNSTQAGKNGAPPTLLPNGKTNPAYLDYVISNLPANQQRSG